MKVKYFILTFLLVLFSSCMNMEMTEEIESIDITQYQTTLSPTTRQIAQDTSYMINDTLLKINNEIINVKEYGYKD